MKSAKDRREVDATLIVRGRMRLRTEKRTKVADNLLHVSTYRALNNIHTVVLKHSWLKNAQNVAFLFGPILLTSCLLTKKDTRLEASLVPRPFLCGRGERGEGRKGLVNNSTPTRIHGISLLFNNR